MSGERAFASNVSVIVPAHDAGEACVSCLMSLAALSPPPGEIVVVDDSGSGACARVARSLQFQTAETRGRRGPAAARNLGARMAGGDILFFVDADVRVPPATVRRIVEHFETYPNIAAMIGSYDEAPAHPGFFSQYKNLVHRYVHQTSSEEAFTFWGACGAIRRSAFDAIGGFDERFTRPSIEDIELGQRLRAAGYRIRLDPELAVTHLKQWTLRSLLLSDIRDRAIPWTRLILETGRAPNDLNLRMSSRVAAAAVCLLVPSALGSIAIPWLRWVALGLVGLLIVIDAPLWRYLARRRGLWFVLRSMGWHWFYYSYGACIFGARWAAAQVNIGLKRPPADRETSAPPSAARSGSDE